VAKAYGYELRTVAAPDTGGATLAEGLKLLEALNVGDPLASGENLYWMTQALHQSSANRFFSNPERVGDAHITRVARAMKAAGGAVRGTTLLPGTHSDYVVAADASGMMVSLCHSVNTNMWGATGINVGGISISDAASFQQEEMVRLRPGDCLPNAMNPTIVFKDGQPVLAFSSVGGGLMSVSLQSVHAVLGLGLGVHEVVQRPRLHGSNLLAGDSVTSGGGGDRGKKPLELTEAIATLRARTLAEGADPRDLEGLMVKKLSLCIENTFDAAVVADAQGRGVRLDPMDVTDRRLSRGFWGAIERDPSSGVLKGGRTPGAAGQIVAA
jgi:gamma-glutamyltranspeptidase/glutathione hydrolase